MRDLLRIKNNNTSMNDSYLRIRHIIIFPILLGISLLMGACDEHNNYQEPPEKLPEVIGPSPDDDNPNTDIPDTSDETEPIRKLHKNSKLKILAIGNSFTNNSTFFLPWLMSELHNDKVCIAKLVWEGSSLSMHWGAHLANSSSYDFYYSEKGNWKISDIHKFDEALSVLDWDIIVIQQVSGYSGDYSTFQPALDYLISYFHSQVPSAKLAWHYTWAYKPGTVHPEFYRYDYDSEIMYERIIEAGDEASSKMDISIPSATLIKEMRKQYPEVTDQFSTDGFHISSGFASFALSSLWYECLVSPELGTSCVTPPVANPWYSNSYLERSYNIIRQLTSN